MYQAPWEQHVIHHIVGFIQIPGTHWVVLYTLYIRSMKFPCLSYEPKQLFTFFLEYTLWSKIQRVYLAKSLLVPYLQSRHWHHQGCQPLKPRTPQEVILPEVIYWLTSIVDWVGFHSSRTRPISRSLSIYMGYRMRGAVEATTPGSLIMPPYFNERNNTVTQGGTRMRCAEA